MFNKNKSEISEKEVVKEKTAPKLTDDENVAAVISKLLYIILPKSNIFCIPNSVLTIVITLVAINYFCVLVNKISPYSSIP